VSTLERTQLDASQLLERVRLLEARLGSIAAAPLSPFNQAELLNRVQALEGRTAAAEAAAQELKFNVDEVRATTIIPTAVTATLAGTAVGCVHCSACGKRLQTSYRLVLLQGCMPADGASSSDQLAGTCQAFDNWQLFQAYIQQLPCCLLRCRALSSGCSWQRAGWPVCITWRGG
jgi:hypothetical protein